MEFLLNEEKRCFITNLNCETLEREDTNDNLNFVTEEKNNIVIKN